MKVLTETPTNTNWTVYKQHLESQRRLSMRQSAPDSWLDRDSLQHKPDWRNVFVWVCAFTSIGFGGYLGWKLGAALLGWLF